MVQCVVMNDIPPEFDPRCAVSEKKTIFTYGVFTLIPVYINPKLSFLTNKMGYRVGLKKDRKNKSA